MQKKKIKITEDQRKHEINRLQKNKVERIRRDKEKEELHNLKIIVFGETTKYMAKLKIIQKAEEYINILEKENLKKKNTIKYIEMKNKNLLKKIEKLN